MYDHVYGLCSLIYIMIVVEMRIKTVVYINGIAVVLCMVYNQWPYWLLQLKEICRFLRLDNTLMLGIYNNKTWILIIAHGHNLI
jgi:hypothetical protein